MGLGSPQLGEAPGLWPVVLSAVPGFFRLRVPHPGPPLPWCPWVRFRTRTRCSSGLRVVSPGSVDPFPPLLCVLPAPPNG